MSENIYTVKNVKTFIGMEGEGFNASLYENGKRVCFVIDSADGGCYDFQWSDREAEKRFDAYVATLPKITTKVGDGKPFTYTQNGDHVVGRLVDEYVTTRNLKRICKKKTAFRLKGEHYNDGEWRTVTAPYSQNVQEFLDNKYPGQVDRILNKELAA